MNNIKQKLLNVQRDLKAPKSQMNKFGGYAFRSCEDILENVKPHLTTNGLVFNLSDEVVQVGDRIYIKATARLSSIDSEEILEVCAFAREPEDKKGSDQSQISGAASSYARKYACNGMFLIDDTKDPDFTNTHGKDQPISATSTQVPGSAGNANDKEMVDRIVSAFWQQTDLAGLEAKMEKAKSTPYGNHPEVVAAYNKLKLKL